MTTDIRKGFVWKTILMTVLCEDIAISQVEYLIITPSMFQQSLQPLVDSKTSQGLSVYLVTLDEIGNQFDGRDIQEKIRNCIKDRFYNHDAHWVLLVGKADADDSPHSSDTLNPTVIDKSWEMPIRYVYCP